MKQQQDKVRIMGLDLSLSCPGIAVIEIKKGKPKLIEVGHVKTSSELSRPERFKLVKSFIEMFYIKHSGKLDIVVRESVPFNKRNMNTTRLLEQVAGLSVLTCVNHDVETIGPKTVKRLITKNGDADKDEVEMAVRKILNIPNGFVFGTNDESDAAAVAIAWAIENKIYERNGA